MNVKVFVGTNILVYSRDQSETNKKIALEWIKILWSLRTRRISHQTLNEYYVTVTQRLKPELSREDARADIRNLIKWNPTVVDYRVIETGWILQDRHGFSWWDSLIIAAAQKQDCDYVLSEDMQHRQRIGKL